MRLFGTLFNINKTPISTIPASSFTSTTVDTTSTGAMTAITGLAGLSFPETPDGSKIFTVYGNIVLSAVTNNQDATIKLHLGQAGTTADTVVWSALQRVTTTASDNRIVGFCGFRVTPVAGDKLTVSITGSAATLTAESSAGASTAFSFIEIKRIYTS